jgi:FtsH-binding integral membrane protein
MNDYSSQPISPTVMDTSVDVGLRNFMLGVYAKLALGLLLTGAIAWTVAHVPAVRDYFFVVDATGRLTGITLLGNIVQWMPIVVILGSMAIRSYTPKTSGILYWGLVSIIGLTGAFWFLYYRLGDIANIFLITASAFGALSLWGYTTKRNISGWGNFLFMAGWGVVGTLILNMLFFHNEGFRVVVSVIGVLVFAAFTAYDTQKLKAVYYQIGGNQQRMAVATNVGALNFYLDFINMFQLLLSLFGGRR